MPVFTAIVNFVTALRLPAGGLCFIGILRHTAARFILSG
ncbi:hypothetical protein RNAN_2946 [Rheinheimera nanhaiensis E407-8]|uniref:Uncharacterized protein n=1 Tax=Rheinheimera nanhaiensis E407-8 TaxID=562729 RepID=I1E0V5_9GAMM|nr:hypothetical protein RNAN_2946 [Rheinheimera nanhaiensis E407-8]